MPNVLPHSASECRYAMIIYLGFQGRNTKLCRFHPKNQHTQSSPIVFWSHPVAMY